MKKETVTVKLYEADRNWLESIKRKLKHKTMQDAFHSVKVLIKQFKLEGELK